MAISLRVFVSNSLSPAKVISIEIDEKEHKATVEVADDQLSLAIGKGGQNVRLAAKLTGWKLNIADQDNLKTKTPREEVKPEEELTKKETAA